LKELKASESLTAEKQRLVSVEGKQKERVDKRVKDGVTVEPRCAAYYDFSDTYAGWLHSLGAMTRDANELVSTVQQLDEDALVEEMDNSLARVDIDAVEDLESTNPNLDRPTLVDFWKGVQVVEQRSKS